MQHRCLILSGRDETVKECVPIPGMLKGYSLSHDQVVLDIGRDMRVLKVDESKTSQL